MLQVRPEAALEIGLDQPVKGPDGMRAANGMLFVADNGSGKISITTVNGDKATVAVIKEELRTPTAVKPAGDTLWTAERGGREDRVDSHVQIFAARCTLLGPFPMVVSIDNGTPPR